MSEVSKYLNGALLITGAHLLSAHQEEIVQEIVDKAMAEVDASISADVPVCVTVEPADKDLYVEVDMDGPRPITLPEAISEIMQTPDAIEMNVQLFELTRIKGAEEIVKLIKYEPEHRKAQHSFVRGKYRKKRYCT